MQYNLTEVLTSEKIEKINKNVPIKVFNFGNIQYEIQNGINIELEISKVSSKEIFLEGTIDTTLLMSCDRCNEPVIYNLEIEVSKEVKIENVVEDIEGENFIDGYNLDLEKFVLNEIYINFPMKILCNEDCKGICKKCGTNLNKQSCECSHDEIDPRLAGLKDLFNEQFKEV